MQILNVRDVFLSPLSPEYSVYKYDIQMHQSEPGTLHYMYIGLNQPSNYFNTFTKFVLTPISLWIWENLDHRDSTLS